MSEWEVGLTLSGNSKSIAENVGPLLEGSDRASNVIETVDPHPDRSAEGVNLLGGLGVKPPNHSSPFLGEGKGPGGRSKGPAKALLPGDLKYER